MKKLVHTFIITLVMAFGLFMAAEASAMTSTWTFTSGGSVSQTGYGNEFTFDSDDFHTVAVTSFGDTGTSETFETGELARWSSGLGTCNQDEGTGCGDPIHQVDNAGQNDWVLFITDDLYEFNTMHIDPYNTWDRDVSFWVGNIDENLDLSGYGYGDLAGLGFGARMDVNNTPSSAGIDIFLGDKIGNALLIGASRTAPTNYDDKDRFKIRSLVASHTSAIPEPATMILFGTGLVGMMRARRRQEA